MTPSSLGTLKSPVTNAWGTKSTTSLSAFSMTLVMSSRLAPVSAPMALTWHPFFSHAPSMKASGLGVHVITMSLSSAASLALSTETNFALGYVFRISSTNAFLASGTMS